MGVMGRPVMIIALVVIMLVVLGWQAFSLTIGSPVSADALPRDAQSRQGFAILTAHYPGCDGTNARPCSRLRTCSAWRRSPTGSRNNRT